MAKIDAHLCKRTFIRPIKAEDCPACNYGEEGVNLKITQQKVDVYNGWKKEIKEKQEKLTKIIKKDNKTIMKKDKKDKKDKKEKEELAAKLEAEKPKKEKE